MGPTWVLSAPDGPHVDPMNLAIREYLRYQLKLQQTNIRRLDVSGRQADRYNGWYVDKQPLWYIHTDRPSQIGRFRGPTWGPSGADRTQVGPMLDPWTLLSGIMHAYDEWHQARVSMLHCIWNIARNINRIWFYQIKLYSDETRIIRSNWTNTIAAGALAPCVAKPSAAILLVVLNKLLIVCHVEGLKPLVLFRCW